MIELQLIAIWEKLLPGIGRRIQPSDNFFDLGGTSFAALRLSEEISQRFDRTLPLGVIFARPTIAQLAALIETGEEVGTSQSLVLLRAGVDRPVFFVHRMLLDLARALDTRRAIWSLSWGLGTQTHHHPVHALPASLEALAGHYVEEMRTLQPEGPYSLAGHSAGGVVAYEMAQQLRAAGETVEFLGLIDSSIAAHFDYRGLRHPLSRILGNLLRLPPRELINNFRRPPPQPEIESFDFWKAYEPRAYPGRVTLFRASTIASVTRQRIPVEQAWQVLAGTLDIIDVPGRHLSMIRPPYVGTLAAKLRECLNAA
jgi:thioesterase domain-containing protein/acyl carrier protein